MIEELETQRDRLERRLEDGWTRINEAEMQGSDVSRWEAFWLSLLAEYEKVCDEIVMRGAA